MAEDNIDEPGPEGPAQAAVRKKRAVKRGTAKKTAAKKTAAKKTAEKAAKKTVGKGRPPKKGAVKKAPMRKTVPRKKTAANAESPAVAGETGSRKRGRPVSVDALRRKLDSAREAARRERDKRRDMSAAAKRKIAEHVARNKALRKELAEARGLLAKVEAQEKEAERIRSEAEKMERDRAEAVASFLARWEKDYAKKAGKEQAGRGRPKQRRSAKKASA